MIGNDRDLRVPRLNLQAAQEFPESQHLQHSSGFQWSVIDDSNLKHESFISPSSSLENTTPACIKQHKLVRREIMSISSAKDIRPDMKVCDLKNLLKDHKMTLKSGEVINTDDMVLTTPRELAVGSTLSDGKTLAESGVGPDAPDLLML